MSSVGNLQLIVAPPTVLTYHAAARVSVVRIWSYYQS